MSTPTTRNDTAPALDEPALEDLLGRVVTDLGGALVVPLALIGDRLGLFTGLRDVGPATAAELAAPGGLAERYVREWLRAMAAAGYVEHVSGDDPISARYRLTPEQAAAFADPDGPASVAGGFQSMSAALRVLDRLTDAFRTGAGIGWHEHHPDLFEGTERFFRPGYVANLTSEWIPALDGVEERLRAGARAVDVGCGFGASTIIMARAYPASTWSGVDYHAPSIEAARERAAAAGVGNVTFEVGPADGLSGSYDFLCFFDCLHDMPDPVGALRAARSAVTDQGTVMLVEPMAWDTVAEGLNPVGKVFAAASLYVCLPSGLSSPPQTGLGNQAGPARTCALAREAGFGAAQVATATPFNLVYELKP
ncbi:methyltransferase domain-containing protein [Pseudonocardia sp. RS11V-5]|uniref:class I SAM-dependent methyltransferase n=1 Tax=Pseudonocardia terrae TaxID=2905831 RepID=UPI001E4CC95E|nr:methyltransferase domain-containing protein [Pseudonocardia terrae]MCE3550783.1 methyltransferase domain-containing protein [Pseudonocardia terrae]